MTTIETIIRDYKAAHMAAYGRDVKIRYCDDGMFRVSAAKSSKSTWEFPCDAEEVQAATQNLLARMEKSK